MRSARSFEPVRWLALPARWIAFALGALAGSSADDPDPEREEPPRAPPVAPTIVIAPRRRAIETPPPRSPTPTAGTPHPLPLLPPEPTGPLALPRGPESIFVSWDPRLPPASGTIAPDRGGGSPALRVRIHPSEGRAGRELLVPLAEDADRAYLVDLLEDAIVDVEVGAIGPQGFTARSTVASCHTPRRTPRGTESARWRDPSTAEALSYDVVTAPVSACRIDFERNAPPPAAPAAHGVPGRPAVPSRP